MDSFRSTATRTEANSERISLTASFARGYFIRPFCCSGPGRTHFGKSAAHGSPKNGHDAGAALLLCTDAEHAVSPSPCATQTHITAKNRLIAKPRLDEKIIMLIKIVPIAAGGQRETRWPEHVSPTSKSSLPTRCLRGSRRRPSC